MAHSFRFMAAGAALALTLVSSAASGQTTGRFVTFGDSLSDPGNIFSVTGQPPAPYFQGRFSNGLTWIEQLSGTQSTFQTFGGGGAGNVDFAFGGARTDANIFSNGSFIPFGLQSQIQSYLSRGGTFSATDTVSIWAGANNLFNAFDTNYPGYTTPTTTSLAAVMTSASTDIKTAVNTLVTNGARKIIVLNLPDLGLTPAYRGTAGQTAATFASLTFNTQLASDLAAVKAANPGLDLVLVDVKSVFDLVSSNPGMFGFTNSSASCVATPSCVTASKSVQNQYAFWDTVHPTEASHQLIAAVVTRYLMWQADGAGLARVADASLATRNEAATRAFGRLDEIRRDEKRADAPWVELIVGSSTGSASGASAGFRQSAIGLSVGAHRQIDPALSFVAEAFFMGGGFRAGVYDGDMVSGGADAVLSWSAHNLFVRAGAGVGFGYYSDLTRATVASLKNVVDPMSFGGSARLEAGVVYQLGSVEISPRGRIGWQAVHFGADTESGIVAPITLRERTVTAFTGGGEVQASYEILRDETRRIVLTGILGYERWFGVDNYNPSATLVSNTAAIARLGGSNPTGPGFLAGVGLGGRLANGMTMSMQYRASVGDRVTRQEARVGVQMKF